MSLVAYDNSDISDSEDEEETITQNKLPTPTNGAFPTEAPNSTNELFTSLPTPVSLSDNVIEETQDEFLKIKEKGVEKPRPKATVRIQIPSLPQRDSDDEDVADEQERKRKRQKLQSNKSGLFAILPSPKNTPLSTSSFVPHTVQRKAQPPKKPTPRPVIRTKKPAASDDEDDIETPDTYDDKMWEKVCGRQAKRKPSIKTVASQPATSGKIIVEAAPEASEPYNGLDNDAFKQLVGSVKRRPENNIKLIDINEDEVRPDKEDWLKGLTDPDQAPKTSVDDPVNDTCRRKHHITYLAQQAKVNEQELQAQWSASRFSRKQTQAKYGF